MNQQEIRLLVRKSLRITKNRAPLIIERVILPPILRGIASYVDDIGKLVVTRTDGDIIIEMAYGIIYDELVNEVITQLQKTMLAKADKRFKTK